MRLPEVPRPAAGKLRPGHLYIETQRPFSSLFAAGFLKQSPTLGCSLECNGSLVSLPLSVAEREEQSGGTGRVGAEGGHVECRRIHNLPGPAWPTLCSRVCLQGKRDPCSVHLVSSSLPLSPSQLLPSHVLAPGPQGTERGGWVPRAYVPALWSVSASRKCLLIS